MNTTWIWIDGARMPWTPERYMTTKPKFQPGRILMTPGAAEVMKKHKTKPSTLLVRHLTGDWGQVCPHDFKANERALNPKDPLRVFSVYDLTTEDTVWVITEHDRSVTTLLLPSEY